MIVAYLSHEMVCWWVQQHTIVVPPFSAPSLQNIERALDMVVSPAYVLPLVEHEKSETPRLKSLPGKVQRSSKSRLSGPPMGLSCIEYYLAHAQEVRFATGYL